MKKILAYLRKGQKTQFEIPINKQLDFINNLPNPKDDIQRSYYQYLSQQFLRNNLQKYLNNLISYFIIFPLIIFYLYKDGNTKFNKPLDAIINEGFPDGIIPETIKKTYNLTTINISKNKSLKLNDFKIIKSLFKYYFKSPFFVLKNLYKIASYSYLYHTFRPNAIIVCNEFSFTSSILTYYCEKKSLKHINIMHGEKLLYIRDSFFRYHQMFVWSEHYENLFKLLKSGTDKFIIELPQSLNFDVNNYLDSNLYTDFKYFLADYSEKEIKIITKALYAIKSKGFSIKFRPHPRFSDLKLLLKFAKEEDIEYPTDVDIFHSISNIRYAIGLYSTVLTQSNYIGKKVIIDDISNKFYYDKLKELDYILFKRNHTLLSSLISKESFK